MSTYYKANKLMFSYGLRNGLRTERILDNKKEKQTSRCPSVGAGDVCFSHDSLSHLEQRDGQSVNDRFILNTNHDSCGA